MLPPEVLSITGAQAWVSRKGPVRLTASTRSHSACVVSSSGLNTAMPALFTSASIRPKRATVSLTATRTCSASATSHTTASVSSPSVASALASSLPSMSSSATE